MLISNVMGDGSIDVRMFAIIMRSFEFVFFGGLADRLSPSPNRTQLLLYNKERYARTSVRVLTSRVSFITSRYLRNGSENSRGRARRSEVPKPAILFCSCEPFYQHPDSNDYKTCPSRTAQSHQ